MSNLTNACGDYIQNTSSWRGDYAVRTTTELSGDLLGKEARVTLVIAADGIHFVPAQHEACPVGRSSRPLLRKTLARIADTLLTAGSESQRIAL
jgi:hypothetical protein